MSYSITRRTLSGEYQLLVKGAETAILDRVVEGDVQAVNKHIMDYAMVSGRFLTHRRNHAKH